MKKNKKIFSVMLNIFSILLILINLYIIYQKEVLKSDTVDFFGYSVLIVISGSMDPEISVDDMIIIKENEEYFINDIVTYKSTNSLITHRIVKIEDGEIYTKGDSNNTLDNPINVEQIKGKVVYKIKGFGKVLSFITSPAVIATFIALTFLMIIKKKN